jgi:hypothetical protein
LAEARRRRDLIMKNTPGAVFPVFEEEHLCEMSPMHFWDAEAA